jgi:hypothetical protein
MRLLIPLVCVAALSLSACSTRFWYDSLQFRQKEYCETLGEPDRTECLRKAPDDYDSYQKQRREVHSDAVKGN